MTVPSFARNGGGRLTDADMQMVALIAAGLTNAQIGDRLGVTADQAKGFIDNALRHGRARNRAHLVSVAYRQGRLPAGDSPEVGKVGKRNGPHLIGCSVWASDKACDCEAR